MQSWENVIYLQEQVPQMQGNPNVKRKVAVLIAYNGKGYHGIQRWLRYFYLRFTLQNFHDNIWLPVLVLVWTIFHENVWIVGIIVPIRLNVELGEFSLK